MEAGDRARSLPTTLETSVRGVSPVHLSWFFSHLPCLAVLFLCSTLSWEDLALPFYHLHLTPTGDIGTYP